MEDLRDKAAYNLKQRSAASLMVDGDHILSAISDWIVFEEIRLHWHGMMPDESYRAIYDAVRESPSGVIVEVGTAHGAATICMAEALQAADRPDRIYTFERGTGGSRAAYGGVDDNVAIINENFERFAVKDRISLIVGDVSNTGKSVETGNIAVLMLDADGRIDRKFRDLLQ
jgi:predicted O-methyltransferase YrrM